MAPIKWRILFPKKNMQNVSTFYLREFGPVCYESALFGDEIELHNFVESLVSSSLDWCWASERQWDAIEEFKEWHLPKARAMTRLTEESSEILYRDFLEEDEDMRRRTIELYGIRKGETIRNSEDLRGKLQEFLEGGSSAIQIVIVQINDMKPQYTFVPQYPNLETKTLLKKLNLGPESVTKTRKYDHLRLAMLESNVDSIIKATIFARPDDLPES